MKAEVHFTDEELVTETFDRVVPQDGFLYCIRVQNEHSIMTNEREMFPAGIQSSKLIPAHRIEEVTAVEE